MGRSDRRQFSRRGWGQILCLGLGLTLISAQAFASDDLLDLSLEDLMNVEVTSVSRKAQNKNHAAAAITVITSDDIRRGGFTSIPEALRIVPGVQVARIDASRWAISVRGFNNEFANKLLVMVDGRSLYTPIFGGTYWDAQNLNIADVERIEVIKGPGGALWGANAVNGVINIITKSSEDTQGAQASVYGGTQEYGGEARYGGKLGENTTFRVSAKGEKTEDYDVNKNYDGNDEWSQYRLGFRTDSKIGDADDLMVQGEYYNVDPTQGTSLLGPPPFFPVVGTVESNFKAQGGSLLSKYAHTISDDSSVEFKAVYDTRTRNANSKFKAHIAEVGMQHDVGLTDGLGLVWGVDYRLFNIHTSQRVTTSSFTPTGTTFHLGSGFFQFTLDLMDDQLQLIAGTKLSGNNWTGFEYQPSGRMVYKPVDGHTLWTAVSRAVRTPTFVDRDLNAVIGVAISGDRNQRSEELLSVEAGYRFYELEWLTAEISGFWSDYEDVSNLGGVVPALAFDNGDEVKTYGGEIEISVMPLDWLRLTGSYSLLAFDFDGSPPAVGTFVGVKKQNPKHSATLRAFLDLPLDFEFDASVYYVDGLDSVVPVGQTRGVSQYVRLDLRLGYKPTEWLEIALVGQNLTDARHAEFNDVQRNQSTQVPRAGYARFTFDF